MAKLTKHASVISTLRDLMYKEAEAQKVTGKPGDVVSESVSTKTDHVDKNSVKPENVKQEYAQKPSTDASKPAAKTAEQLGEEISKIIQSKLAEAQDSVSGKPGDVVSESVSAKTDDVDKNKAKPEDVKQDYAQTPSTDASKPAAKTASEEKKEKETPSEEKKEKETPAVEVAEAKKDDVATKVASFELGRQLACELIKAAQDASKYNEVELSKEAGRRDFDTLISQAADELYKEKVQADQEKLAEALGAAAFDDMLKTAALQEVVNENESLKKQAAELAEIKKYASEVQAQANEKSEREKMASEITAQVIAALKASAPSDAK